MRPRRGSRGMVDLTLDMCAFPDWDVTPPVGLLVVVRGHCTQCAAGQHTVCVLLKSAVGVCT